METEKKLLLFTVEVYLCDDEAITAFTIPAYNGQEAEFFIKDYLDQYITDDYRIHGVFETKIK